MTRFDTGLFEAAVEEGRRENRSARQQLEHWTRIGQMFSANETSSRRRITGVVRGQLPLSVLSADERLVANIELDVAIRERTTGTSFGRALLKTGLNAVALDDDGVLVDFRPDGSPRPVEDDPQASRPVADG